jgi:hypothetical protein
MADPIWPICRVCGRDRYTIVCPCMLPEPDPDEEDEPIPYSEMTEYDRRDIEDRWIPHTR